MNPGEWMSFIDGENLTIRAQELCKAEGIPLIEGPFHVKDVFLWFPQAGPGYGSSLMTNVPMVHGNAVRAAYYTSVKGDDEAVLNIRERIWYRRFEPHVFKKSRRDVKAKGVDIALTKDMLSHAFLGNYRIAVLFAGDGDYVPLVEEVKRLGKQVVVAFFRDGLSPELRLSADYLCDLTEPLIEGWKEYRPPKR